MNRKVRKTFIGAFLATSLFIGVNSVSAVTIKETTVAENENLDKIADNTTIIGATKFEPGVVLTAMRIAKATTNDVYLNLDTPNYDGVKIYNYLFGTWYVLDENNDTRPLGKDEEHKAEDAITLEKLKEQAIYYVNNEEKVLEIPYTRKVDDGYKLVFIADSKEIADSEALADAKKLTYDAGKIQVPATVKKVAVYAVKETVDENPAVITKLDEFSKTKLENSTYDEVKSSLGSITYGETTDASTITIDNIAWASSTIEKASGYYATVKINVPEMYNDSYTTKAKYYIDTLADLAQPTNLTEEALTQELTFDKNHMTHTITVIWDEGNTQVFTVTAKALGAAKAGVVSYGETTSVDNKLTINSVEWYDGQKTIAIDSTAGNYAKVKISTGEYSASDLANDEKATYYIGEDSTNKVSLSSNATEVTLKFDKDNMTQTITVEWENGNIQVFEVTAKELASATAGSLTNDKDTATSNFTYENNTATINGNIKWYSTGADTDYEGKAATAGNFKSVIINAPDIYKASTSVQVQVYNGSNELSKETWNVNSDGAKYSLALNFAITKEYKVVVTWEKGNVQTFTIKLGENATLNDATAGTISYKTTSSDNDNVLTINDEIAYSKATEASESVAGNYAEVEINVPKDYQGKQVDVKIGGVTDSTASATATIAKRLNFAANKQYTIEVTWETGNVQTFTIKLGENAIVKAAPAGTITAKDLTINNGKLSGTVNYVKEKGNVITYTITAPETYAKNVQPKITFEVYNSNSEKTYTKEYQDAFTESVYNLEYVADKIFAKNVITIEWETGNKQVITITAGEELLLETKPNYVSSVEIVAPKDNQDAPQNIDTMIIGEDDKDSIKLDVKVVGVDNTKDATHPEVTWSSSDEKIAKVDAEGNVTAIGFGDAIITVASKEDSTIKSTYTVHVKYPAIEDKTTVSDPVIEDKITGYKKTVEINFAAEGGSGKGFAYSYEIEGKDAKITDERTDNCLKLTVSENKTYTVKYTITDTTDYTSNTKTVSITI